MAFCAGSLFELSRRMVTCSASANGMRRARMLPGHTPGSFRPGRGWTRRKSPRLGTWRIRGTPGRRGQARAVGCDPTVPDGVVEELLVLAEQEAPVAVAAEQCIVEVADDRRFPRPGLARGQRPVQSIAGNVEALVVGARYSAAVCRQATAAVSRFEAGVAAGICSWAWSRGWPAAGWRRLLLFWFVAWMGPGQYVRAGMAVCFHTSRRAVPQSRWRNDVTD